VIPTRTEGIVSKSDLNEDIPIRAFAMLCARYAVRSGTDVQQVASVFADELHNFQGTSQEEFRGAVLERWAEHAIALNLSSRDNRA
jgi:hypothetical protein